MSRLRLRIKWSDKICLVIKESLYQLRCSNVCCTLSIAMMISNLRKGEVYRASLKID